MPSLTLPPPLSAVDNVEAVRLVRGYLAADPELTGGVAFTGSAFDTWTGVDGKRDSPNHLTDADITAVAFLSVQVPPRAALELQRRSSDLSSLLKRVPDDVDLHLAPADLVGPTSAASLLWQHLRDIDGIGWVTAGKLLARKRPRLIPVYDRVVRNLLGLQDGSFWEPLRVALQADNAALARKLRAIGDAAGGQHLTVLRVFDVVCWRYGSDPPK